MSVYNYKAGLGNVGSFQTSGVPYVTGGINLSSSGAPSSSFSITFPSVTRWFVISNTDATLAVNIGFAAAGTGNTNFLVLPAGSVSPRIEMKVTELHLSGGSTAISVMAGLTGIETRQINNSSVSPSGSNWSGSLQALVG